MKLIATTLAYVFLSCALQAGYVFKMEQKDEGKNQSSRQIEISVDGKNMKVHSAADNALVVYRGAEDEVLFVDNSKKQYYTIDRKTMENMGKQLAAARAQMEEALKQVPEAQREMMKRMMPAMPEKPAIPEFRVEKTSEKKEVNGFNATKAIIYSDGVKTAEVWLAPLNKVKGAEELMTSTKAFGEFFSEMMEQLAGMNQMQDSSQQLMTQMGKLDGFPVVTRNFENGKHVSTTTLSGVEEKKLPASEFNAPAGYKKQKLQMPQ